METIFTCQNCKYLFNEELVLPKILKCGHTFCLLCITESKEILDTCFTCETPIAEDCDAIPTNKSILGLLQLEKPLEYRRSRLYAKIKEMKLNYKSKQNILLENEKALVGELNFVCDGLNYLKDFEYKKKNNDKELYRLEQRFFMPEKREESRYFKVRNSVSINLWNHESPMEYLTKIYKCLLEDKRIFSVQYINGEILNGKISMKDDWIFFHSLSLKEMPSVDESVWFQDLKHCIEENKFRTFLNFQRGSNRVLETVIVKLLNTHLSPKFVRLCTGESGSSYKDCIFNLENFNYFYYRGWEYPVSESDEMKEPSNIQIYNKDFEGCGYFRASKTVFDFNKDDIIVKMCPNSFFKLVKCFGETKCRNVIGKVENPTNLDPLILNMSSPKIIDCGIMIQL